MISSILRRLALVLALGVAGLGLAACDEGPGENAGETLDDAAEDAGDAMENTGERIEQEAQ